MNANILIVDDDTAVLESLKEYIQLVGFVTLTAGSSEEALDLLKVADVEIVITDILLPGMDGLELTEQAKNKYGADVIVMTGYSGNYSYEEAINKGASDFVFKPVRFEELLLRVRRVLKEREMSRERTEMLEKLQKLSITDGLTKLYNSRYFYAQLKSEIGRSNRYEHPLSLLLLDIDRFKAYNDTYGHLEGDKVLVKLGQTVKSCLRKMDSAYRYGGEEFTVILPETIGEEAETVANRIRTAVQEDRFYPEGEEAVGITISIGVTEYMLQEDITSLIQRADQAMYLSKQSGRNKVSILSAEKSTS
jgi:diguanylate cyclase (GGDEF)-like protein